MFWLSVICFPLLLCACSAGPTAQADTAAGSPPAGRLARTDGRTSLLGSTDSPATSEPAATTFTPTTPTATTPTTTAPTTTTTAPPIELGSAEVPFRALPAAQEPTALVTPSGVVVPIVEQHAAGWLVETPCQNTRYLTEGQAITRAHVVLDPGHGGAEPGAVGKSGLREKDLNLLIAKMAAQQLEQAGATVVLARTADYTITAASRGRIAAAIKPALLVSIHHNGGAPAGGDRPGTIVFAKTDSPESERFGGLFFQHLQPVLIHAAEPKIERHRQYVEELNAHEAQVAAYDQSVAARDLALVANGQILAEATTTVPIAAPVEAGHARLPSLRTPIATTTLPPDPAIGSPLPVPDTVPIPVPLTVEPIAEFSWAGSGNAGVRSWTRSDGHDYLAVLRNSGDVPAVLAEFVYLSNPAEEALLADPTFIEAEAGALAKSIIHYFADPNASGSGHVQDQFDDQPIGGSGGVDNCVEPDL